VLSGQPPEDAPGRAHEAVGKVSFRWTERKNDPDGCTHARQHVGVTNATPAQGVEFEYPRAREYHVGSLRL
jgi:hypothetical protein